MIVLGEMNKFDIDEKSNSINTYKRQPYLSDAELDLPAKTKCE